MSEYFEKMNDAIIKYNTCTRNAKQFPDCILSDGLKWDDRAEYWRSQAEKLAEQLGTRIIPVPSNPDVITAELFLKLAGMN
jgi:hypothetical protein